jgi:predicted O-linked N-acetylglucosamine transferase (SPINDLY family)
MKIELSQGTIDALKQIDATYEQINQQGQETLNQLQSQLQQLANQKNMILSVVRLEKNVDPAIKLRLNEDYSLEEITDEQFKELTAKADIIVKDEGEE